MKRSWMNRHFGWIRDDFRRLVAQLRQAETWVVIGMLAMFFLIAFFVIRLALRSDTMLRALHPAMTFCRELTDNAVAFIFVGMIFFVLTALAALGELFVYIDSKRRQARYATQEALKGIIQWGGISLFLGLSILVYLDLRCT